MSASVYPEGARVLRHASLSPDLDYRYWLSREFALPEEPQRSLAFVMLNPSTADADDDDPTIRKCVGFARRLGYTGISVFNLFAYRATDPDDLRRAMRAGVDVVGRPENDRRLSVMLDASRAAGRPVVAAWGAQRGIDERVAEVLAMPGAVAMSVLGRTASGAPRHPLMLGYKGAALTPILRGPLVTIVDPQAVDRPVDDRPEET